MYLAKFFHRPPGDDDRELLLIPGSDHTVIGIYMDEGHEEPRDSFLREEFSDIRIAVYALHRHAAELAAAGYMETAHTRYTLRNLLPNPQPKPDWQKGLDELMMAALSEPLEEQARHLAALRGTPAEHEPLYLWLAARHGYAADEEKRPDDSPCRTGARHDCGPPHGQNTALRMVDRRERTRGVHAGSAELGTSARGRSASSA
jgi:hypothetical protein